MRSPDRTRLAYLDGMRGLAALAVVFHHVWLTIWPFEYGRAPSGIARATDFLAYGHFAVAVFIVLSGYCLTRPISAAAGLAGGAFGFLRRRARRILPPYYAAFGLSLLLATTVVSKHTGTHWDISIPVRSSGVIGNALLVQNVYGQAQVNHAFWSIAVECQIYLLFPLLVVLLLRRGLGAAIGAAAGLAAGLCLLVVAHPAVGPFWLGGLTPQYLFLFALGMAAAQLGSRFDRVPWSALAAASTGVVVALILFLGRGGVFAGFAWIDPFVGLATAALLVSLARERASRVRALLEHRWIAALGAMAYSVYLIHAPLVQLAWQVGVQPLRIGGLPAFALLVVLAVPFVLVCSTVFFRLCERPFVSSRRAQPTGVDPRTLPMPALTAAMITPANVTIPSARTNVSSKNR